jgi:hypothetical protein
VFVSLSLYADRIYNAETFTMWDVDDIELTNSHSPTLLGMPLRVKRITSGYGPCPRCSGTSWSRTSEIAFGSSVLTARSICSCEESRPNMKRPVRRRHAVARGEESNRAQGHTSTQPTKVSPTPPTHTDASLAPHTSVQAEEKRLATTIFWKFFE